MSDNATHHMVTKANGETRCAYCGKLARELGSEPTQQACPSAPK